MSLCTPCTPCPPCDSEYPLLCEPLETTANGKRLVVEDSAACQKTIQTPATQQVLKTDGATNLAWTNGANNTVLAKSSTGIVEFDQVQTAYIADSAVTTAKINNLAVTTAKIADVNVTTAKIADNAITTAKIADNAVNTLEIANEAVTSAKLRDSAALSVIGRSANSTGVPADIVAGADGRFLRRSSSVLGFGAIVSDDLPAGTVLNAKFYESSTEFEITNVIPFDNSTPQNGEGQQIITGSITPTKTTSKILGIVSLNGDSSSTSVQTVVAVFRGSVADAIDATWVRYINYSSLVAFQFIDSPNTTSATTYSIRTGPDAGILYINKTNTGSILGGSNKISLTLLEINPS
jgi:hypothetical protein